MTIEQIAAEQYPYPWNSRKTSEQEYWEEGFVAGYEYAQQQRRWIPVSERLPTKEDADEKGLVEAIFDDGSVGLKNIWYIHQKEYITHWRTPEKVEI